MTTFAQFYRDLNATLRAQNAQPVDRSHARDAYDAAAGCPLEDIAAAIIAAREDEAAFAARASRATKTDATGCAPRGAQAAPRGTT